MPPVLTLIECPCSRLGRIGWTDGITDDRSHTHRDTRRGSDWILSAYNKRAHSSVCMPSTLSPHLTPSIHANDCESDRVRTYRTRSRRNVDTHDRVSRISSARCIHALSMCSGRRVCVLASPQWCRRWKTNPTVHGPHTVRPSHPRHAHTRQRHCWMRHNRLHRVARLARSRIAIFTW